MLRRFLPICPLLLALSLTGCLAMPAAAPVAGLPMAKPSAADGTGAASPATPDTGGYASGHGAPQQAAPLRAGDVDDNADFPAYLRYLGDFRGSGVRPLNVSERIVIQVRDAAQKGVPDAEVRVKAGFTTLWQGRTASDGRLLFFPQRDAASADQQRYTLEVHKGQETITQEQERSSTTWNASLTQTVDRSQSTNLDLLFVIDATGSMGDEISRLQSTLQTVAQRVRELNGNHRVRFGLVSYRDHGDSERTNLVPFTETLGDFQTRLNQLQADGGGDYAEDLEAGLDLAMREPAWSSEGATRLAFVIADAPPHIDYQGSPAYGDSIRLAVQKGIKLYTLGASGLDATGEYVFRQLAQQTLAKYLFLTYGGEPGPGGSVSATVGGFQENNLDDLIVGIVKQELAPLQP
jgi:Mg-chelatase subunit ChlD